MTIDFSVDTWRAGSLAHPSTCVAYSATIVASRTSLGGGCHEIIRIGGDQVSGRRICGDISIVNPGGG